MEEEPKCLKRLKFANPQMYRVVCSLREKHDVVMKLPPDLAYRIQCYALVRMIRCGEARKLDIVDIFSNEQS